MVLVGFDPGGIQRFGWAMLHVSAGGDVIRLRTGVVSGAPAAVRAASDVASSAPEGVGIDAPLFWVEEGDRRVDAHIRTRVIAAGGKSGTVSSVNSLQGACLVQGILAARLAASSWPSAIITEAHPKARLRLSTNAAQFVTTHVLPSSQEHERDAALAAYAAWAAVTAHPQWRNLALEEIAPFFPGGREVTYWFPR